MPSLELLPRDVIWKIIDFSQETILNFRLVSRSIQSQVDDYAILRVNIPIVNKMEFREYIIPTINYTRVYVLIPSKKSYIFSLRLQLHKPLEHFTKNQIKKYRRYQLREDMITYEMTLNQLDDERISLKYLRECIGRHIEIVEVVNYNEIYKQEIVRELIKEMKIGRTEIFFSIITEQILLLVNEMVIGHNVEQLSISVGRFTTSVDTVINFLTDISNNILTMEMHQLCVAGIDLSTPYFFGLQNSDWARIILEMFSKKLSKLYIKNEYYPKYLSLESAELLKECLPTIGKSIWFYASCDKYQYNVDYEHNNHSVQVSRSGFLQGSVIIKHYSRVNELLVNC